MMGDAPIERGVANGADSTTIPMVARDPSGQLSNNVLYKATISVPADLAVKWDLITTAGYAVWQLHVENALRVLAEGIPIAELNCPHLEGVTRTDGAVSPWTAEQLPLVLEQRARYVEISARIYSWLSRQIVLTDIDAKYVAANYLTTQDGIAMYDWIVSHHTPDTVASAQKSLMNQYKALSIPANYSLADMQVAFKEHHYLWHSIKSFQC